MNTPSPAALHLMCVSLASRLERAPAHAARVRPFVGVQTHVSTQVGARTVQVAAILAHVRLDVCMHAAYVQLKMIIFHECLRALGARVWPFAGV